MRLHDFLDYWAREQPEVAFAVQAGRSLSYGAAVLAANRLANAFIAAGLAPGDRVAVLAKNSAARRAPHGQPHRTRERSPARPSRSSAART